MNAPQKRKRSLDAQPGHTSAESSDDDFDWQNLDLNTATEVEDPVQANEAITFNVKSISEAESRTRPPTSAIERKIRFEIHKLHLLCLMSHVGLRNKWCSDVKVQQALRPIISRFKGNVRPKATSAPLQQTRVLLEGLGQACDLWSQTYKVTRKGLTKPKWYTEEDLAKVLRADLQLGTVESIDDVIEQARTMQGSRDTGAQLFVAFLRALGLDVRLLCSLQPLGLSAGRNNLATFIEDTRPVQVEIKKEISAAVPARPHKLTRPSLSAPKRKPPAMPKPQVQQVQPIVENAYPIYWAEVFDAGAQTWYPLDPLVTDTVNKETAFEPPASETENDLLYIIGFEKDGSARDLTRRYTKQYNAKVRRKRVDSVSSGQLWWQRLMKLYKCRYQRDRNDIEDGLMAQKELSEGIPNNVADLKNHPHFVIERHLHKDEIIEPRRECGTIRIGKTKPATIEKVYPRKHVLKLRSSLTWYMRGRQVKAGEQPLKSRERKGDFDDTEYGFSNDGLFSEQQTEIYVPEPVVNGVIPKNQYGNIDLFTPSMIPPGATHFPYRDAEKVAQILGIDFAVAITGFDHANRTSLPIRQGVVVATEYIDAMSAVHEAVLLETEEHAQSVKIIAALKRWTRFLAALRIREHVQTRYGETAKSPEEADSGAGW